MTDSSNGNTGTEGPSGQSEGKIFTSTPQWTSPVFYSGLGIGGLLIIAGFASTMFNVGTPAMAALVLAGGLGIILGAFGATALLKYQGLTVTGVGVLAIVLYSLLTGGTARHLIIAVKGVPPGSQASLYADDELHGSLRGKGYEFVLLNNAIKAGTMDFSLAWTGVDKRPNEALIAGISVETIRKLVGSGQTTEWIFSAADRSLTIGGRTFSNGRNDMPKQEAALLSGFGFVGSAHAQEGPLAVPEIVLDDLDSDNLYLRRLARAKLGELGPDAVPTMMEYWKADPGSYYKSLGVSVALTKMLDENQNNANAVGNWLQAEDYMVLVDATNAKDPTLQKYATDFLSGLGSPASTPIIIGAWPTASTEGQANSIRVLSNVAENLDPDAKADLITALQGPAVASYLQPMTENDYRLLLEKLKAM